MQIRHDRPKHAVGPWFDQDTVLAVIDRVEDAGRIATVAARLADSRSGQVVLCAVAEGPQRAERLRRRLGFQPIHARLTENAVAALEHFPVPYRLEFLQIDTTRALHRRQEVFAAGVIEIAEDWSATSIVMSSTPFRSSPGILARRIHSRLSTEMVVCEERGGRILHSHPAMVERA